MRGISKKMFISILTSVIVFVTMVATTFAWVGIFTYANTENFSFNLKVSELDANYFLTISATGKTGSFSDEVDIVEIQKQILKNQKRWNENEIENFSRDEITHLYSRYSYVTPSTTTIEDNKLTDFQAIEMSNKDRFRYYSPNNACLKFDLYISVNTKEGIKLDSNNLASEDLSINSNVYMTELQNTLIGTLSSYKLFNGNQFSNLPSIDPNNVLRGIPGTSVFKINSANAARFALSIYNPINISESYDDSIEPTKTFIYQGGTQVPTLENDIYNLGGNLPEDSNTALKELLVIRSSYKTVNPGAAQYEEALEKAILRGQNDIELVGEKTSIWSRPLTPGTIDNSTYNYLGVQDRIQTKLKVTVYFWFEGWDADCLKGINEKPVNMNLTFTSGIID